MQRKATTPPLLGGEFGQPNLFLRMDLNGKWEMAGMSTSGRINGRLIRLLLDYLTIDDSTY